MKKSWGHRKNFGRKLGFKNFGNFQHQTYLSLVKWGNERNQFDWLGKIHDHRRKRQENDKFSTKQSPILSSNFIRGSTVIVMPHNVQL